MLLDRARTSRDKGHAEVDVDCLTRLKSYVVIRRVAGLVYNRDYPVKVQSPHTYVTEGVSSTDLVQPRRCAVDVDCRARIKTKLSYAARSPVSHPYIRT